MAEITAAISKRITRTHRCRHDGLQKSSCRNRRRYGKAIDFLREKGLAAAA